MATDNPKVAAYLQPTNYELLKIFSQAVQSGRHSACCVVSRS